MSRGPGRIQQEIAALIVAHADGAWTTAGLCQHVYGLVEKKHRIAVIRALERIKLPPLWTLCVLGHRGGELCLYNTGDVTSTLRKQCFSRGEDGSDLAVLKDWGDRKRAKKDVRDAVRYHEASPIEKIEIRLGNVREFVRCFGDGDGSGAEAIAQLEAELAELQAAQPSHR